MSSKGSFGHSRPSVAQGTRVLWPVICEDQLAGVMCDSLELSFVRMVHVWDPLGGVSLV